MNVSVDQLLPRQAFRGIFKTGAVAALLAALIFRRNLDAEWMLLRGLGWVSAGPAAAPDTIGGWFELLEQIPLLGLTLLNLFDLVNYALVGLILLALAAALWKTNPSGMVIAAVLSCLGVGVFIASNQALTLYALSQQYAIAATAAQKETLLAAGQAVLAIHQTAGYAGSGVYPSFFLVSLSGLLIALSMFESRCFTKTTAILGILANGFQLSYYLVRIAAPALVFIPISISAVFLLLWYVLAGIRLWSLGCGRATVGKNKSNIRMEPQTSTGLKIS